jgi:hypothetical protein
MEPLLTFQPMVGTIDQPNQLYLARGADPTGTEPDINEAETVAWIPLDDAEDRIRRGEIVGAGSVTGLLAVLLARATGRLQPGSSPAPFAP